MRAKQKAAFFKEVADIRRLQRAAAEANALRAAASLAATERTHVEARRRCDETAEEWQSAMTAPSVLMDITTIWAAALRAANTVLDTAAAEVDDARVKMDRQRGALEGAITRQDWAIETSRKASKRWARHRDEAALSVMSD